MTEHLESRFTWPVRVYYEDTDTGGVVYHANYLRFMERARTEWLRALGFEQDELRDHHGILFAVTRMDIAFKRPARFNDRLDVHCRLDRVRRVGFDFHQEIHRQGEGTLLCTADVGLVCLDAGRLRPKAVPARILERIQDGR